ncbi:MAG: glycosyltransferase [Thermodesulfovibrionales bacterium]
MIAAAKYSSRLGKLKHSILSLLPAHAEAVALAKESNFRVISQPEKSKILSEIQNADIVQIHFWNTPEMYEFLRSALPPMRLILWYHISGDGPPQIITENLVNFADFNIPSNPYTYNNLPVFRNMNIEEKYNKVAMVYDAADFDRVKGVRLKRHQNFNVGYIGLVHFSKMHHNYVSMSASIEIPNIRFIVCGGGIENLLREQAQQLGIAERFDFRGYVNDIKKAIQIFDAYGYPLCEDTYASAELNLQEVMYAGIPPVVFPYGGVKSLVIHDFTGLIVHSELEYKQAIEYLYHHPEERLRIGKNAKAYAKQIFGAENAAMKLNPIYKQIMKLPKKKRKWKYYVDIEGNLLDKPVSLSDITDITPKLSGSEAFIESLGDKAQIFATSRNSQDIQFLLEADKKIANSSEVLVFAGGGIHNYSSYYPDDGYFRLWKGLILKNQDHHMEAISEFSSAIKLGCNHWRINWYLAQAAEKTGDTTLAIENLQEVIKSAPEFTEAKEMLDELEKNKIQAESTSFESDITAPSEGKPDIKEITSGTAADVSAGFNKSQPVEETTKSEWPEEVISLVQKAEELIAKGNLSDLAYACDAIHDALDIVPDDPILLVTLGKILLRMGQREAARREFEKATKLAPDFVSLLLSQLNIEHPAEPEQSIMPEEKPEENDDKLIRSNLPYWQKMQEKDYFEEHQWYGKQYGGLKLFGNDLDIINRYLKLTPNMKVVVIGCGYGREAALIAPHVKHVYGIDVSKTILRKAEKFMQEQGINNFTPILADNWKALIPDNIDLVYEIVVFQHITRELVKDYIHGLSQKLSPGGNFLCQFSNSPQGEHDAELRVYEPSVSWNIQEIEELIEGSGLVKISVETVELSPSSWYWAYFGKV